MSELIEVCGFVGVADVGSPMAISRHLILPASSPTKASSPKKQEKSTADLEIIEDDATDEARIPSFCVLLHGALRVENMAALVNIGKLPI